MSNFILSYSRDSRILCHLDLEYLYSDWQEMLQLISLNYFIDVLGQWVHLIAIFRVLTAADIIYRLSSIDYHHLAGQYLFLYAKEIWTITHSDLIRQYFCIRIISSQLLLRGHQHCHSVAAVSWVPIIVRGVVDCTYINTSTLSN